MWKCVRDKESDGYGSRLGWLSSDAWLWIKWSQWTLALSVQHSVEHPYPLFSTRLPALRPYQLLPLSHPWFPIDMQRVSLTTTPVTIQSPPSSPGHPSHLPKDSFIAMFYKRWKRRESTDRGDWTNRCPDRQWRSGEGLADRVGSEANSKETADADSESSERESIKLIKTWLIDNTCEFHNAPSHKGIFSHPIFFVYNIILPL